MLDPGTTGGHTPPIPGSPGHHGAVQQGMDTLHFDPEHARRLAADLLAAADRPRREITPTLPDSPALTRLTTALNRALHHLDARSHTLHGQARRLAEDSLHTIDAATGTDRALATDLGALA